MEISQKSHRIIVQNLYTVQNYWHNGNPSQWLSKSRELPVENVWEPLPKGDHNEHLPWFVLLTAQSCLYLCMVIQQCQYSTYSLWGIFGSQRSPGELEHSTFQHTAGTYRKALYLWLPALLWNVLCAFAAACTASAGLEQDWGSNVCMGKWNQWVCSPDLFVALTVKITFQNMQK